MIQLVYIYKLQSVIYVSFKSVKFIIFLGFAAKKGTYSL